MADQLHQWRNTFSISDYKNLARNKNNNMTVAVLACGGLICTMASIRAGWRPIWSTEIDTTQQAMWEDFTGTKCLGDTFKADFSNGSIERPVFLTSGQPCPNYTLTADQSGKDGATGWMFTKQVDKIFELMPMCIRLEMTDNALNIHNGAEVAEVITRLERHYIVMDEVLKVWEYGDVSHRQRLFIVGFHKDMGEYAQIFRWPEADFDSSNPIRGRDIAVADDQVPQKFWREATSDDKRVPFKDPKFGELHQLASSGIGMGPPQCGHKTNSWEAIFNTQTTLNGGARRPALNWQVTPDGDIGPTRLTTPIEAVRAASVTEEYLQYIATFDNSDEFLFKSVNNGIPMRTCTAIDTQIMRVVEMWMARPTDAKLAWEVSGAFTRHHCHQLQAVDKGRTRSMAIDSGANLTMLYNDIQNKLSNKQPSSILINVANDEYMPGVFDGDLKILVDKNGDDGKTQAFEMDISGTTADQLSRELFSLDPGYKYEGLNALLIQPDFAVKCTRCGHENKLGGPQLRVGDKQTRVPIRYDYHDGGFWLDYDVHRRSDNKSYDNFKASLAQRAYSTELSVPEFDRLQTIQIIDRFRAHSGIQEIFTAQHHDDREFRGVKSGLRPKQQKLTATEFHELFGHIGSCPGCKICAEFKGCMRKIYKVIDKHRELRPNHTWVLDTVTWSHRSFDGEKYMAVLRDTATSAFHVLCLYLKSDVRQQLEDWITQLRARPEYQNMGYKPVQKIVCDNAGEWDMRCEAWDQLQRRCGFETIWTSPDSKRENAKAERACGIVEVVTKSLMVQRNLPRTWWALCAEQACWLLNRFPVTSLDISVPMDGDRVRPLERLSNFFYSRRQIDRELSYFVQVGTLCLVHDPKVKGSAFASKTKFGIAIRMYREQVVFISPFNGAQFKSKSYYAMHSRPGLNAWQLLNLTTPGKTIRSSALHQDFDDKIVIELPHHKEQQPGFSGVKSAIERVTFNQHDGEEQEVETKEHIQVTTTKVSSELGGSIEVRDSQGQLLDIDKETGELQCAQAIAESKVQPTNAKCNKRKRTAVEVVDRDSISVVIEHCTLMQDFVEAKEAANSVIIANANQTFSKICKLHGMKHQQHSLYRKWLIKMKQPNHYGQPMQKSDMPFKRRAYVKAGTVFPKPSGSLWRKMCQAESSKSQVDEYNELVQEAIQSVQEEIKGTKSGDEIKFAHSATAFTSFNCDEGWDQLAKVLQSLQGDREMATAFAAKKRKVKAVGTKAGKAPATIKEALRSEFREQWQESIGNEINGLTDMGVLTHRVTKQQLVERGITSKPVQLGLYFDYKFDELGNVVRYKTRAAVQGHKGNMIKGVHYFETFAATPKEDTERILQAILVLNNLIRRSADVEKAFCWAELAEGDKIALKYPRGMEQFDEDGNELYMVCERNLYGTPSASRNWSQYRDDTILDEFNCSEQKPDSPWTCVKSEMDPCLFHFTYTHSDSKIIEQCWAVIHTDDIDAVATHDFIVDSIFKRLNEIWKIKIVDSNYILGVRRELARDSNNKVTSVELTMPAFVQGMADAFEEHRIDASIHTPFPDKCKLSKDDAADDQESMLIKSMGYQRAVGMILWAARHVFPECKHGCSQICSVMASPSHKAFKAAMHMINYMLQRKERGIKFSASGNKVPVSMSDASFKADPEDGKCYHGWVIMWAGGPIACTSKKLTHVGTSSEHAEYMGLFYNMKAVVWLRQLMEEMGWDRYIEQPTVIFGDNVCANRLAKDHFVSQANQHIYTSYHWVREAVSLGFAEIKWCNTQFNLADIMTKAVPSSVINKLVNILTGYGDMQQFESMLIANIDRDACKMINSKN